MKNDVAARYAGRVLPMALLFILTAALIIAGASPAAQKEKKKKKDNAPAADSAHPLIPMSDEQQIDYLLSEVLGAWQVGDIESMQQVRMDRANTYIKVNGTVAWACYQWDFGALVDGQPSTSQGQTTLVLEKRNNHWVIVHNHTSLVQMSQPATPASAPTQQQPPAKPAGS